MKRETVRRMVSGRKKKRWKKLLARVKQGCLWLLLILLLNAIGWCVASRL